MTGETAFFDFSSAKPGDSNPHALASLLPRTPDQVRLDILKEEATVGRTDESDLVVPHRNVSKKHAKFVKDGTMWELQDIGSTNGTFVNGTKVTSPVLISPGDIVSFGDQAYVFTVAGVETPVAPVEEEAPVAAPQGGMTAMFSSLFEGAQAQAGSQGAPINQPMPAPIGTASRPAHGVSGVGPAAPDDAPAPGDNRTMLRSFNVSGIQEARVYGMLVEKSLSARQFSLNSLRNRIGSAVTNEVRINDRSILPEHAEIIYERDGRVRMRVVDNDVHVKVNGDPVKLQFLRDLDTVQVGDIVFTYKQLALPVPEDFAGPEGASAGGGGGAMKVLLLLLLLAGGGAAGVYFYAPELIGMAPRDAEQVEATPTPELPNVSPNRSELDTIEGLFLKNSLVEARDRIARLDQSDAEVTAMSQAINSAIEAEQALNAENVQRAMAAMARLSGSTYSDSEIVRRLTGRLELLREVKAKENYDLGTRNFVAERYEDALASFTRSQEIVADYRDVGDQVARATLAAAATRALRTAREAISEGSTALGTDITRETRVAAFERAEAALAPVIRDFEAAQGRAVVADVLQRFQQQLINHMQLSRMRRNYLQGRGSEALAAFVAITEPMLTDLHLERQSERIRQVMALAQEAVDNNSLEKAREVLMNETDPHNVYVELATSIVNELAAAQRAQAEQYFNTGREFAAQQNLLEALAAYHRARTLDPSWREAGNAHDTAANQLLIQAYQLPTGDAFVQRKIDIYRWIIQNSKPEDRVHQVATRQLRQIAP